MQSKTGNCLILDFPFSYNLKDATYSKLRSSYIEFVSSSNLVEMAKLFFGGQNEFYGIL